MGWLVPKAAPEINGRMQSSTQPPAGSLANGFGLESARAVDAIEVGQAFVVVHIARLALLGRLCAFSAGVAVGVFNALRARHARGSIDALQHAFHRRGVAYVVGAIAWEDGVRIASCAFGRRDAARALAGLKVDAA